MMIDFDNLTERTENMTRTENGALSFSTTGSKLIDQFAHAGTSLCRPIQEVFADQAEIWDENPEMAIRFPFYLRMITRKTKLSENLSTEKVQRGSGLRDEAFKRLLWVAQNHREVFENNIWLLPIVGSWKDLWSLMLTAETNRVQVNHKVIYSVLAAGLKDSTQTDLIKKYLPAIKSSTKCKTERAELLNALAKDFANFLGVSAKQYRQLKSSGTAHDFQKLICAGRYDQIEWNKVPGKALTSLVSGKFLGNHGLENGYLEWVEAQPTVKFNGYVYELGKKLGVRSGYYGYESTASKITRITVDKQFDNLIKTAKSDNGGIKGNVLCALDTSDSMTGPIEGANGLTSYDVCISLGIYFSELNEGYFHNKVAMFDNVSTLATFDGTFSEKWNAVMKTKTAWGGTNFLSVVRLLIDERRKHPEIPESEFPSTLLVVSDMQFNPSNCYDYNRRSLTEMTNQEAGRELLRGVFSDEFVDNFTFVWWYCASRSGAGHDVPATMNDGGNYVFSGFDGSVISLLLGGDVNENGETVRPTMEEMVIRALSQEILAYAKL